MFRFHSRSVWHTPGFLDQFRDFFESSKGCSDLENLCNEYASSPDDILEIISTIYSNLTVKSAKNRLTRLSNALKKIIHDFNSCQNADPDGDDDETDMEIINPYTNNIPNK